MFFKGLHTVENLYDSHVHWMSTGQVSSSWNLKSVAHPEQILSAPILPEYFRGTWITGFGWDETVWPKDFRIHRHFLDRLSTQNPVLLSRKDGHSSWANSKALEVLDFLNPKSEKFRKFKDHIGVDEAGQPTGHLKESAHMQALFQIPWPEESLQKSFLLRAAESFNRAGFTHIRDMTSSLAQWRLNYELLSEPDFLLHVEHWFVCEKIEDLTDLLDQLKECKRSENPWMKIRGIKIFVDGSLGSNTARISNPYPQHDHSGQMLWTEIDVKTILRSTWQAGFQVALHSLGDEASHQLVNWAREIYSEGLQGHLHLEHTEIVRPETIQNMKSLHIRCHLQPCHWWSDRLWLREKLGDLSQFAFPWESLRKAQIPMSFGSDSPIEESDLFSNLRALEASATAGIRKLGIPGLSFHVYPYDDAVRGWVKFEDDKVLSVGLGDRNKKY